MKVILPYLMLIVILITSCSKYENFAGYEDTSEDELSPLTLASSKTHSTIEADLFEIINDHRASIGLNKMKFEDTSYYYANLHTSYMISQENISHDKFTNRAENIVKRTGALFVAENVARNYETINDAFNGWMNSSGHKKNIEGDFNYSAISIIENANGDLYFTQIFVKS
ncbi:CAP domain-containing protein [Maribacter ulvicola]|uniref:Cysteine-rich secretory protein family protein n=1 Tax=Maribacter ulvicola TaxID=228959 RepID=A0A1N6P2R6_9FLAO|nr:CAP domain-containing protein [Maribacter ulvicola]SIP98553.1 Cysteine-rich secretory protein family protein [Maribacter ulvicola]